MASSCAEPGEKSAEDKKHLTFGWKDVTNLWSANECFRVSFSLFFLFVGCWVVVFVVVVVVVVLVLVLVLVLFLLFLFRGCFLRAPQHLHTM